MSISYEWDAETVDEHGDIADHATPPRRTVAQWGPEPTSGGTRWKGDDMKRKRIRADHEFWQVQCLDLQTGNWLTIYRETSRPKALAMQRQWRYRRPLHCAGTRLISPTLFPLPKAEVAGT